MKNAAALICLLSLSTGAFGAEENAARLVEVSADPPTVRCLSVQALVAGDRNANSAIAVQYRELNSAGEGTAAAPAEPGAWKTGLPLFRTAAEALRKEIPEGTVLFAGSIFDLAPETTYEICLTFSDPDGGEAVRALTLSTRGEPRFEPVRTLYIVPGDGGGSGTKADPFKGLEAADAAAKPGDLFLLAEGTYPAPFDVTASGEPGKPVVYRAAEAEKAVIAGPDGGKRPARGIDATDVHDVWFEGLAIRQADWGIVAHGSQRIVVRHCRIYDVDYGFTCTRNEPLTTDFFLSDNTLEGPCTWPRTKGIEDPRGFQVSGTGHVVCYNRITGFADGIDTFRSAQCSAIDIYGNEIADMTDDGIETDYSEQNVRCFENRLTNCFQGISEQPVFGGPVYIFRNAIYNIEVEPFKMHTSGTDVTSGFLLFHNTCVKQGLPWMVWTNARVNNVVARNNLFIGTPTEADGSATTYAMDFSARMENCDFDYDGFGGGPFANFAKWLGTVYPAMDDLREKGPIERQATMVDADTLFASGVKAPADVKQRYSVDINDLRLAATSGAVDKGVVLPNVNDGFAGKAPDLGAYEFGKPLPHYGPRPMSAQQQGVSAE